MAIEIQIQGTVIEFPESAAEPNWAPAIIEFAQAVEAALNQVTGAFDVAPQVQIIDAYNPGVAIDMPNFAFPVSDVRAVDIIYSVFRSTTDETVAEMGSIQMVYNPDGPVSQKWETSRESTGDAKISFAVTDLGQVTFTTQTMTGTNHVGRLTYQAKALLQD
jgi:hypothetical protein